MSYFEETEVKIGVAFGRPAVPKISTILQKYPKLGAFFMLSWSKQIGVSVNCIALKKLFNVEVRKLEIFALNYTFLGQKRLQTPIELRVALM